MLKRDKLEAVLRKITGKEFDAVWKDTYGYIPRGERADLVRDFVAEQYDRELDGCIKRAEAFLKPPQNPSPRIGGWFPASQPPGRGAAEFRRIQSLIDGKPCLGYYSPLSPRNSGGWR